jgi:hypothetical protein
MIFLRECLSWFFRSREAPGYGDAGPLKYGYISVVVTPSNYVFSFSRTIENPKLTFHRGPDESFGKFIEKHWVPGDRQMRKKIKEYVIENRRNKREK